MDQGRQRGWRYLECRSSDEDWPGGSPSLVFFGHHLDLACGEESLFKNLDGSLRRGIRKAEAAGLRIQFDDTWHPFIPTTRCTARRAGVMGCPRSRSDSSLIAAVYASAGLGFVAIARLENKPVAAAVFLHQGRHAIYKFGASDYGFPALAPQQPPDVGGHPPVRRPWLFEPAFRAHFSGQRRIAAFQTWIWGREEESSISNMTLARGGLSPTWTARKAGSTAFFGWLPPPLLRLAGELLYPHIPDSDLTRSNAIAIMVF